MNSFGAPGFPQVRTWYERPRIGIDCDEDGVTATFSVLLAQRVAVDPASAILAVVLESYRILLFHRANAGAAVGVTLAVGQWKSLEIDLGRWIGAGRRRRLWLGRRFGRGRRGRLAARRRRRWSGGRRDAGASRDDDRRQHKCESTTTNCEFRHGVCGSQSE